MRKFFIVIVVLGLWLSLPTPSFAASLSLSPPDATVNKGCSFSVDVVVDTQGKQTNGTDAVLVYDPQIFTATSIQNGTIYTSYPGSNIDAKTGKVNVSGLSSLTSGFAGKGTLATVLFTISTQAKVTTSTIRFDFDANNPTKTTDSNVVDQTTAADLLISVANANYTIGETACGTSPTSQTNKQPSSTTTAAAAAGGPSLKTILIIAGTIWVIFDLTFLIRLIQKRG